MTLEEFIKEFESSGSHKVIPSSVLREFMKGKVVVDASAIRFACGELQLSIASGEFVSKSYHRPNNPHQNERIRFQKLCLSVLQQALQQSTPAPLESK